MAALHGGAGGGRVSVLKTTTLFRFSLRRGFSYLLGPALRPRLTLERFLCDPRRVTYAALGLLLLGALCSATVYIGYLRGFGAVLPPALKIPAETYYLWQALFCLPLLFAAAVLFAGCARLIASSLGGQGSFEDAFAVVGVALVLPLFVTLWLPESALIIAAPQLRAQPLGGFAMLPTWADAGRQIVALAWPLLFATLGIKRAEKMGWLRTALTTLLALVPPAALALVFVR